MPEAVNVKPIRWESISPINIISLVLAALGVLGYAIFSSAFNPVNYRAGSYSELRVQEWLPVAKANLIFVLPALFLFFKATFQHTSKRKLFLFSVFIGALLTVPQYVQNLRRWNSLTPIVQGLPVSEIRYFRHDGGFLSFDIPTMGLKFIIPNEDFVHVENTINSRIDKSLHSRIDFFVDFRTNEGKEIPRKFYDPKTFEGEIEGEINLTRY